MFAARNAKRGEIMGANYMSSGLNPILPPVTACPSSASGPADPNRATAAAEQEALTARKRAIKARSERIAAALVEAISTPIDARELETLDRDEDANQSMGDPQAGRL